MNGFARFLEPQYNLPLSLSFSSIGHPNRFPFKALTVALVYRIDDDRLPDNRLIVMLRERAGGTNESTRVPVILLNERSIVLNCVSALISGYHLCGIIRVRVGIRMQ